MTYRLRNGFDHRGVSMAVVQEMVSPQAAGTLFMADPVASNRKIVAVEAVLGIGEALVSAMTDADAYKVRDGELVASTITGAARDRRPNRASRTACASLSEAHFGHPQDVKWCPAGDEFAVPTDWVRSRRAGHAAS